MIWVEILINIILAITCGVTIYLWLKCKKEVDDAWETWRQSVIDQAQKIKELNNEIKELNNENKTLTENINNFKLDAVKIDSRKQLLRQLEEQTKVAQNLLTAKQTELEAISTNAAKIVTDQEEKLNQVKELEKAIKELESRIVDGENKKNNLLASILEVGNELDELKIRHAAVLKVEEGKGNGWELPVSDKQLRFIQLIHTIINDYPEYPMLAKELRKVEWSAVWLPLVQQLCLREKLDRGGIYKITLKKDDKICYIGQAVNIKDRWYTHIKKMIGVEATGNERLYEYRPEDVKWEVVEFKDGKLDEDEKYWIDYFKCREIGLNKKR